MSRIAAACPAAPNPRRRPVPAWHRVFVAMLPKILAYARGAFSHLKPEARQEAVQNVVTNSCAAVAALARRGKLDLAYPTVLAQYGIRQTRDNRITGGTLNIRDVMSKYCQMKKNVIVERLDKYDSAAGEWEEIIIEDRHTTPADIVRVRCDFRDFLGSLPRRNRRIAEFLSLGHRTSDAARKFGVSEGRVSQLRKELAESWRRFVGDESGPAAANAA
jgi:hypothetical protein